METIKKTKENNQVNDSMNKRTVSVAPMLDWTDKHYRFMARLITHHAWLYTEMIHANAIVYGNADDLLQTSEQEQPISLQLGGSEPALLAEAARKAMSYGYNEINLNCGCPSPRVQKGAFGACLMQDVQRVTDCLNAMQDAVSIPVTIKHRIGLDKQTDYQPLADFVGTLHDKTACRVFIVHARNAWLQGLSPKDNRTIPPLRYDFVYRLKQEFPDLEIIINGGIRTNAEISQHLQHVDGVMIGREAYHHPMIMQDWDKLFYADGHIPITYSELVITLMNYARQELTKPQVKLQQLTRHYLGLLHSYHGARQWRQLLSDASLLKNNQAELILTAWQTSQADMATS